MTAVNTKFDAIEDSELKQHAQSLRNSRLDGAIRALTAEVSGKVTHRAMAGLVEAYNIANGQEAARLAGDQSATDDAILAGSNDCKCENMARWGLPCYHWLWQCILTNRTMPKTFLHIRWFLFSIYKAERALNWKPS